MKTIKELIPLTLEMFEEVEKETDFSERAIAIVNEIADFAEETTLYKSQAERGRFLEKESAQHIYAYLCDRICNAPTAMHQTSSIMLIMPYLRRALGNGPERELAPER